MLNLVDDEIQIYDLMGYTYFNMEELESAKYYHTRSVQAVKEDKGSILRKISLDSLRE